MKDGFAIVQVVRMHTVWSSCVFSEKNMNFYNERLAASELFIASYVITKRIPRTLKDVACICLIHVEAKPQLTLCKDLQHSTKRKCLLYFFTRTFKDCKMLINSIKWHSATGYADRHIRRSP